jgi:hypothetical protein
MITLFHAIQSLVPGAEISVGLYNQEITWHKPETAPVTLEQIQAEQQRLQQAYDWQEYRRNRAREYPSIEEQLDALYHAGVFPADMASRIRAVKAKYPRYVPDQTQTIDIEQTVPKMSVDEWLTEETKKTADQWLREQQQSATPMTKEQWLASQVDVKTTHDISPTNAVTVTITRKMSTEEWLQEQAALENTQTLTREQWLEQQKTLSQSRQMTREEWLAEQLNLEN